MASFNWVDYIIIGIVAFSTLSGMMRGFLREFIALLTWVAAFFIASAFAARLAAIFTDSDSAHSMVQSASVSIGANVGEPVSFLALGISFVCIFVVTLFIGGMIGSLFSSMAFVGLSFVNLIGGAVFGLARGLLIDLVIIFLVQLTPFEEETWWKQSRLVKSFQPAVARVGEFIEPGFKGIKSKIGGAVSGAMKSAESVFGNIYKFNNF